MKNFTLEETKGQTKRGLRLILKQFKYRKKELAVIVLLVLISTAVTVYLPQLLKQAIDVDIANKDLAALTNTALQFVGLLVVFFIASTIQMRLTGILGQKVLFSLRQQIFDHIQHLPLAFFTQNRSGDIITRLTSNVEGINRFFSEGLVRSINIIFSLIGFVGFMFYLNASLALIMIAATIIFFVFLLIQGNILEKRQKTALDAEGDANGQLQEIINGFQTIKMYEKEDAFLEKFSTYNEILYAKNIKTAVVSGIADGFLPLITILSGLAVLLLSFEFYNQGILTQGGVISFFAYVIQYFRRFEGISGLWGSIQNGLASAERIQEILSLRTNIENSAEPYLPTTVRGEIAFEHVHFSYEDGTPVLKNINLHVQPGQTIAVVGPTGGGKTSFVGLIARLYDTDKGSVKIDDVSVKDWDLSALRKSIGYLIQDSIFFKDTLLNNMRYNNETVTEKQIWEIFDQLGIREFAESLPQKLKTVIDPANNTISQGQKQILALARLLLRDPQILILDEATANIDTKTELLIQKAIDLIRHKKTAFIIAHRLSTIVNADYIVLIQNNSILESGTHKELIKKNGMYAEIYRKFSAK